jgi:hypothetical protein
MSRKIRRVPADWQHPKGWDGRYSPLVDHNFVEDADEWVKNFLAWEKDNHPDREQSECRYYWEWAGDPPDPKDYHPDWPEESRTHYQVYEEVSEGTPISPVFATIEEVHTWLLEQGWSEKWAEMLCKDMWVPSGFMSQSNGRMTFESYPLGQRVSS